MPLNNSGFTHKHSISLFLVLAVTLTYILVADSKSDHILLLSLEYPGIDKLVHYILHMGIVTVLYFLGRRLWPSTGKTLILTIAFALSLLFGILDEFQQLLVANRDFDAQDLLANFLGSVTTLLLFLSQDPERSRLKVILVLPVIAIGILYSHSNTNELYYKAGLLHMKQNNYLLARQSFLAAIDHGQKYPALYNELAWLELEYLDTDPATALTYSYQAVLSEPNNADYLDTYGWALYRNGRHHDALEILLRSYTLKPSGYCIHYHLGSVYFALKKNALALHHFQLQLDINRTDRFADKTRKMITTIDFVNVFIKN